MDPQVPFALAIVGASLAFAGRRPLGACARGLFGLRRRHPAPAGAAEGHAPSASGCAGCASRGACASRVF